MFSIDILNPPRWLSIFKSNSGYERKLSVFFLNFRILPLWRKLLMKWITKKVLKCPKPGIRLFWISAFALKLRLKDIGMDIYPAKFQSDRSTLNFLSTAVPGSCTLSEDLWYYLWPTLKPEKYAHDAVEEGEKRRLSCVCLSPSRVSLGGRLRESRTRVGTAQNSLFPETVYSGVLEGAEDDAHIYF